MNRTLLIIAIVAVLKNLTDDYDAFYIPMDSYNIGRDYGPAPFNKPHVLVVPLLGALSLAACTPSGPDDAEVASVLRNSSRPGESPANEVGAGMQWRRGGGGGGQGPGREVLHVRAPGGRAGAAAAGARGGADGGAAHHPGHPPVLDQLQAHPTHRGAQEADHGSQTAGTFVGAQLHRGRGVRRRLRTVARRRAASSHHPASR